jgi:DNA end-binding protein Ku
MARAIWSGSISFGLVNIPVKLFSATEPQDVRFHQLEEGTGERIHYKRVAGDSNREVPYDKIVKGYEASKRKYVVVTPEELESVEPTRSRTIEIEDFVDLDEIDPIYFEKTYYLAPSKESGGEKPYALLRRAIEETNRVAIGTFVLRTKQYLAAIRPSNGILTLETMFFADEVRGADDIEELPVKATVGKRELDIAKQLIEAQATEFDPKKYRDAYREAVLKLIQDKAKGKEIVVEEEAEPAKVHDLMEALRASVEAVKKGERIRPEKKGTAARTAGGRKKRAAAGGKDLLGMSKEELYERAQELDIAGRSDMSKKELVSALRRAS